MEVTIEKYYKHFGLPAGALMQVYGTIYVLSLVNVSKREMAWVSIGAHSTTLVAPHPVENPDKVSYEEMKKITGIALHDAELLSESFSADVMERVMKRPSPCFG